MQVRKKATVSGPDRSPWFLVSAYDSQGVELLCELHQGVRKARSRREELAREPGVGSAVSELLPDSYGGTQ
jgi:hypothetical protein